MSKLYSEYQKLKAKNSEKIYLFKSGIFYISLDEDAKKLSELFNFKITNLNENVIKVGFPLKRLEFYIEKLKQNKIDFEIIDNNYIKIDNYSDYYKNENIKSIINYVIELDMNEISFKQAFEILSNLNIKLKKLYKY